MFKKITESMFGKKVPLENYSADISQKLSSANVQLTKGTYAGLENAVSLFADVKQMAQRTDNKDVRSLADQLYGQSTQAFKTYEKMNQQCERYAPGFIPIHVAGTTGLLLQDRIKTLYQTYSTLTDLVATSLPKDEGCN